MAFQQSKSSLMQTAFNVAGTVVAALANAGIVTDVDDALAKLNTVKDDVFAQLTSEFDAEGGAPAAASNGGGAKQYDGNMITFGKYKGKSIQEVADSDPSYIEWLAKNANFEDTRKAAKAEVDKRRASV